MNSVEKFLNTIAPPVAAMAGFSVGVLALGALGMSMKDVSDIITEWGKVVIGVTVGANIIVKAIIEPIEQWSRTKEDMGFGKQKKIRQMQYAFER